MNLRRITSTLSPTGWAFSAVAVLIVVLVAAWFITAPGRERASAARAVASAAASKGDAEAAKGAVNITAGRAESEAATDDQTRSNRDEILSAPGASAPVDPGVDCAGRRAICMRQSARGLPACRELQRACP